MRALNRFIVGSLQRVALAAALLLCCCGGNAATVIGNLKDMGLGVVRTNITFTAINGPLSRGNSLLLSPPKSTISDSSGNFSIVLTANDYGVKAGGVARDVVWITVDNTTNTYQLVDLITNELTFTYTQQPIYEQKMNKGVPFGYAPLDENGKVPTDNLPPFAISSGTTGTIYDDDSGDDILDDGS